MAFNLDATVKTKSLVEFRDELSEPFVIKKEKPEKDGLESRH